jgi:outer membrane protein assembly factor BamB
MMLLGSVVFGADWPQWRGPYFNGSTIETNLPAALDPNQTLLWKTPLPGKSAATPVIAAGKVYLASTENGSDRLLAMCLDAGTGHVLWQYPAGIANQKFPMANTMASCSPCADADGAAFLFGEGTLVKLDTAGKEIWKRNLALDYGTLALKFGYSSSPLLLDGRLYIPVLQSQRPASEPNSPDAINSYLLCVNAIDGKTIFKQNRPTDALEESTNAYTTPLPVTIGGQTQIVVYGGDYVTGHEPQTGKELWRHCYGDKTIRNNRQIPTPVVAGNLLVCGYPRGERTFALDLDKLAANQPAQVWLIDQPGSDITSAALYQGALYQLTEKEKLLTCLDPKTGRVHWTSDLDKSDSYYASVAAGDGKLYMVNRKGVVTVAAADTTAFKILSTYDFGEKTVDSSIVISNGKVYLRTPENLYCFGIKK